MGYLALYRQYRPTKFEKLIGQDHIVKTLTNQIESGRLGHAYLFTGSRGTGKTSAAKIFAKAINCLSPENGSPCGKCASCLALSDTSNIDVVELDAASNNGVNEIRDLREKVQYPPVSCKYKVYIVDEVHMLTGAAFNALLKTLEEPPKHAVFILATTEVHKIPATILSRCMRFDFRLIPTENIAKLIANIYTENGKEFEEQAVFAIAKAGEGSIRDALSIADIAISYGSGKLTYNDVMEILGTSNQDVLLKFVCDVVNSNVQGVLTSIDTMAKLGKGIGMIIKDVTAIVRDLIVVKSCEDANKMLALPDTRYNEYLNIAKSVNEQKLLRILEVFSDAESSLRYSNHPRIVFETASIKASAPEADYSIDALLSRIKTLENKLDEFEKNGVKIVNSQKVESEEKVSNINNDATIVNETPKKFSLSNMDKSEIKGKLLLRLRQIGSEMLWNIMQNVDVEIRGNILVFTASNSGDQEILDSMASRERIEEALNEYIPFELQVKLCEQKIEDDAVDKATAKIKSIFGDDIVIIK